MKLKYILVSICIVLITIIAVFSFRYFYHLLQQSHLPKVALVIDDWGYNLNNINLLRSIDIPITLAILPNLKYSKEIAKESNSKKREAILHMPMEPSGYFLRLEKDTVTTSMGEEEIASIFLKALSSVPGVRGVSNHMGSRFTADSEKMNIFLKQVKKKRLFFYDSVACKDSVCEEIASELKVKFIKRDVFLDGVNNINYIKGQLQKLIEIAKKRGYAVGTGHDRVKTLEVIKELAPALKDKVRFVFVSELSK